MISIFFVPISDNPKIGVNNKKNTINENMLKISLLKGEYVVWVTAEGFEPWKGKILLLGEGYKQNVMARLNKSKALKKANVE